MQDASLAVRSLIAGLSPALRPRWRYAVLQAYVDDSGSDLQGPVYLLTGYVSDVEAWEKFTRDWDHALRESPAIEYFKMREAESLKEQFEGWSRSDADAKVRHLIPLINHYTKHRIECVFWQAHYESAMKWFLPKIAKQMSPLDASRVRKAFSNPYFLAFSLTMTDFAQRLANEQSSEIVDFIFDTQGAIGKNAVEWWREMNEIFPNIYKDKYLPNEPIHRDEKIFLPLQAADLLAWQTRRWLYEHHVVHATVKRQEMKMLEAVHLYPNRWNEQRLREMLKQTLIPLPNEHSA